MAQEFVLVRLINMRGVDLNVFDFDYDLTWAAFFINAQGGIYGRYGGREEGPAEAHLTLAGLKNAMRAALAAYRHDPNAEPSEPPRPPFSVEQYPAAKRLKENACIHCHMVYDFRREAQEDKGLWSREELWVYPPPKNVGLSLDVDQPNRIVAVSEHSPADRVGLRAGDLLRSLNNLQVASYGDVQYALHRAPKDGTIPVTWLRDGARQEMSGKLTLPPDWRHSDISWRTSLWGVSPTTGGVYGKDLTASEKRSLGIPENQLAFRQGDYIPKTARDAGIRAGDVVLGIDNLTLDITMLQFQAFVRLNHNVGDRVTFNVIRAGKRLEIPVVLPKKD